MKTNKKLISLFVVVLFVLANVTSSFAANQIVESEAGLTTAPSEIFIDICDGFFSDIETASAINADGVDVTKQFYNTYLSAYNRGNYAVIKAACADFEEFAYIANETTTRAAKGLVTKSVEKRAYNLVYADALLEGKTFEYSYSIIGSYTYDTEEMIVTSASLPSFTILDYNIGAAFHLYATRLSCPNANEISSSGDRVTFRVRYNMTAIWYSDESWSHELRRATFGAYNDSVVGYPG